MESNLSAVEAVKPLAPYLGGKRNLSRRLCTLIATIPHRTYVEPFVGMGGVFLRRTSRPPVEVINDISADVTTLFRVARKHYEPLAAELEEMITSRDDFERLRRVDPDTLTDIERAARFIYLQRLSFGGKLMGRTYGVDRRSPSRLRQASLRADLRRLRQRLAAVTIERLPYADLIRRYDGPDTLFYLDPPYWGCEEDYGAGTFGRGDFEALASQLEAIAGRFVLSINATDGAREIFGRFSFEEVPTTYTVGAGVAQRVSELIVTG